MPSKNTIRVFVKDGIYHIYNRGVEKRNIFLDVQDYKVFLYYMKIYLSPINKENKTPLNILKLGSNFDLYKNINLLCYALMPNHFHFLIKQISEDAITEFMKRLISAYVKYFNNKYERVGPLFQGRYKGILVLEDEYFTYLSFYIHANPIDILSSPKDLEDYFYSSYLDYIGKRNTPWIHKDYILNYIEKDKNKFAVYKELTEKFILELNKNKQKLAPISLE